MAETKAKLGRKPCLGCGHPTYVKTNAAGTVSMACDECDLSLFAKKGTTAAKKLCEGLTPAKPEATPAPPAPAKKPSPLAGILGL